LAAGAAGTGRAMYRRRPRFERKPVAAYGYSVAGVWVTYAGYFALDIAHCQFGSVDRVIDWVFTVRQVFEDHSSRTILRACCALDAHHRYRVGQELYIADLDIVQPGAEHDEGRVVLNRAPQEPAVYLAAVNTAQAEQRPARIFVLVDTAAVEVDGLTGADANEPGACGNSVSDLAAEAVEVDIVGALQHDRAPAPLLGQFDIQSEELERGSIGDVQRRYGAWRLGDTDVLEVRVVRVVHVHSGVVDDDVLERRQGAVRHVQRVVVRVSLLPDTHPLHI